MIPSSHQSGTMALCRFGRIRSLGSWSVPLPSLPGSPEKTFDWLTFRHSLGTNQRSLGFDIRVAQELLRHANSRITRDIYWQTVTRERRAALTLAFNELWADKARSSGMSSDRTHENPRGPQKEEVELVIN